MPIKFLDEKVQPSLGGVRFLDEEPTEEVSVKDDPVFRETLKQEAKKDVLPFQGQLGDRDIAAEAGAKITGIEAPPTLAERIPRTLPGVGQFIGGLAGGVMGGRAGIPLRGAAAGGVIGRTIGATGEQLIKRGQEAFERLSAKPPEDFLKLLTPKSIGEIIQPKKTGIAIGKEAFSAAVTEAIGGGIARGGRVIGKNIVEAALGKRVAERGFEVGFKQLLKKENFKGRIPKMISEKIGSFWGRLTKVTGESVDNSIKGLKGKERIISTSPVREEIGSLRKLLGEVDDLGAEVSPQQKKLIKGIMSDSERLFKKDILTGKTRTTADVNEVWQLRKRLDDILFGKGFSDSAKEYLFGIRTALNRPIKSASPLVEKQFSRYRFVKELQKEGEKDFRTRTVDGKVFAKKPERFAGNLLKTAKDEEIAELKQLDSFLGLNDRVVEDLLDVAASEAIDKPFELLGLGSRIAAGTVGGKRLVAGLAGIPQMKAISIPTAAVGRTIPTMFTEALREPEEQQ